MNHTNEKERQQMKKKTCRGNRKEQHKRRRLHLQQQKVTNNTNHIHQNVNNYSVREREEQIQTYSLNNCLQTKSENKRKCQDLNQNGIHLNQSFSQLSISQENNPKKKRRTNTIDNESNNQRVTVANGHKNLEEYNNKSLPTNMMQKFKPQYLKVSDHIFKQILSNAIKDSDKIVQCLDTNEKLQFIRRITEVTNNLHYIKLQQQLWQNYYNLSMKEGDVRTTSRVSKSFAEQHHTCRTYGFPKRIIEQRQKTIQHQLQRTINELQHYLIELEQYSKQWQPSFDVNVLSHVINECVTKGQQRLRQEFDYKMKILSLDSNDHNLIRKFYELQPDKEQIDLAKIIWRTTSDKLKMKEYEEILRKRIYLQRLQSGIDKIIN